MSAKRIAVIGGGASGLTATKSCLEEDLEPVCFERRDEIGGLWRYTLQPKDGQSGVMRSTVIKTSKELSAFSDFPPPKDFPNFMHNDVVWKYLTLYSQRFQLDRYIRYNNEVTSLRRADDFAESGRWIVESYDHKTGQEKKEIFDAVLVCTGHHAEKKIPSFPGQNQFEGDIVHSHDYRTPEKYIGKRVLVVGIGNSGGDLAVELSSFGKVVLSTRRGFWLMNLTGSGGKPWDIEFNSRLNVYLTSLLPFSWLQRTFTADLNDKLNHDFYGITPQHLPLSQHPTANQDLAFRILSGAVKIKGDVKRFTKNAVEFEDGTVEEIDAVVLATGYIFGFPFIEKELIDIKDNQLALYKNMFLPSLQKQTLSMIGYVQPWGCIFPLSELMSRYAVRVFKGLTQLPSSKDMWADIRQKEEELSNRYVKSTRHTIQADWVQFMDELAELVGCKPNIGSYFMKDPILWKHLVFGPCVPYQYRLDGPNPWSGARQAILTAVDRIEGALQTRPLTSNTRGIDRVAAWLLHPPQVVVLLLELFFFLMILNFILF